MSRIGKKPIIIPEGVEVKMENGALGVKGPLGETRRVFKGDISISVDKDKKEINLKPSAEKKISRPKEVSALWGTYASHIRNMVLGVTKGFSKSLVIEGVGYRASKEGSTLVLSLGFSHPVKVQIPQGIDSKIEKNIITLSGVDKEQVGAFAAKIKALKKPEPYKGKGIRYEGEIIRHKAGKKAATSAA